MIFRYFRGVQGYVPAASHVLTGKDRKLSTWVGTALSLAKMNMRRVAIRKYVDMLQGKTILLCKTLEECEFMLRTHSEHGVFLPAKTTSAKRSEILNEFFAREFGLLIMTDTMFGHLAGFKLGKVQHIVLTVYGIHGGYFCGAVYKCNPDVFHHIVDNVNAKGIIPKFVQNLQQVGNIVEVDKETLTCFKFDRNLDNLLEI